MSSTHTQAFRIILLFFTLTFMCEQHHMALNQNNRKEISCIWKNGFLSSGWMIHRTFNLYFFDDSKSLTEMCFLFKNSLHFIKWLSLTKWQSVFNAHKKNSAKFILKIVKMSPLAIFYPKYVSKCKRTLWHLIEK